MAYCILGLILEKESRLIQEVSHLLGDANSPFKPRLEIVNK
jgi:hypothetical protein